MEHSASDSPSRRCASKSSPDWKATVVVLLVGLLGGVIGWIAADRAVRALQDVGEGDEAIGFLLFTGPFIESGGDVLIRILCVTCGVGIGIVIGVLPFLIRAWSRMWRLSRARSPLRGEVRRG